jgi:hypothetical protein
LRQGFEAQKARFRAVRRAFGHHIKGVFGGDIMGFPGGGREELRKSAPMRCLAGVFA